MNMKILGDPHLGREFRNSVPLHRRGERERLIREHFVRELDPQGSGLHVCMGDLFDQPVVSLDTIWFAASSYITASLDHPNTTFVVIRGNHDDSRDLGQVSAFDIFKGLVASRPNIFVVDDKPLQLGAGTVFFGWCPDKSAEELVASASISGATTAFGHWDVDLRSAPHNLIPTKALAEKGITKIYTGHIHLPTTFTRDGIDVVVTGSMQPYAHGEDATGEWYVTLTREELDATDPATLKDKCVRVLLKAGETTDVQLDCLQLKYERVEEVVDDGGVEVTMDGFDLGKTFAEVFQQFTLVDNVKEKIDSRWQTTFTQQG
jgi:DNA repair exonuclease SbcCD nuclease subunit